MPQPTDTHRTAKDLSPEELAQYRQRLDQQLQNRKVDKALLRRAWDTAYRIAAMLYKDFGASHVAVFGSLAQGTWFSKSSDIDIDKLPLRLTYVCPMEAEDIRNCWHRWQNLMLNDDP